MSRKATMIPIQGMFKNGKADIVLKTVKYKKNSFYNFEFRKYLKIGNFVLVMLNKMLVLVLPVDFYSQYGPGSK